MSQAAKNVLVLKGKQDVEFAGHPPLMKLSYDYLHPFAKVADAYLKRANWEGRMKLTTISHVS